MAIDKDFVKITKVRAGVRLRCDGGFTCINEHDVVTVREDPEGQLYVECRNGVHYLDGQASPDGTYVGLYPYHGDN